MICVGIDVAKDKHDCFILSSEGEVLADVFTIPNSAEGFDTLLQTVRQIADAHLAHLKTVLLDASKGRYGREKAIEIRNAARNSIGSRMPAKSLELKRTIQLIRELMQRLRKLRLDS